MYIEYNFDNDVINTLIVTSLFLYTLLGTYLFSKLTYITYLSEYNKDPNFEHPPTSLLWKIPLLTILATPLLAIPLIGGFMTLGYTMYHLIIPFFKPENINLYQYITSTILFILYLFFVSKKLQFFLYSFVKKHFEFEMYFREHAKSIITGNPITINKREYHYVAFIGKIILHFGYAYFFIDMLIVYLSTLFI